ncbi:MAG: glycosyltransferase family 4 protein [Prevotella sp.]|nr:glycosyltransferase family 4 protein [Prevotella sp.]
MKTMNKRLLIVTELFPPDETSTSYILGEIANAMAQKYDVGVICGPEIYDKRKKFDRNNHFVLDESIDVVRSEIPPLDKNTFLGKVLRFFIISWKMYRAAKKHIKKGEKVLLVTNPAPLVVLMGRLRRTCRFELSLLVHDVFPENTKPAGIKIPSWAYRWIAKVFAKAYGRVDRMIAIGRDMKQVLTKKVASYNSNPDVRIIENWADIEGIKPQPFPEGKIKLQYAGNIGRVQGLDRLIGFLPEDVEFHIYGTGSMEEKLKEMKRENVYFHGPYFRSQQNEVLAACDIAVVSLQKGMYGLGVPSKTYNILAAGRPVLFIGEEDSEIGLLVNEKQIGYVFNPNDEKGIKEFLNQLSPERRDVLMAMGQRAREVAEQEYAKDVILNKFVKVI